MTPTPRPPGTVGDPRWTAAYRRLRADLRRAWQARDAPCAHDGQRIDWTAPPDDPASFQLDHVVPVSVDRDRALDPTNCLPSHRRCNSSRGNGPMPLDLGTPSRRW